MIVNSTKLVVAPLLTLVLCGAPASAVAKSSSGYHKVEGYYRKNGTYVRPHYRSNPDGIKSNNFSETGKPSWMRAEERYGHSSAPTSGISGPGWDGEKVLLVLFVLAVIAVVIVWLVSTSDSREPTPQVAMTSPPPLPRRYSLRRNVSRRPRRR